MSSHKNEIEQTPLTRVEWAVEVTWRDWRKAGAKGPTSQFGPFESSTHRDRFLADQRRDRDVAATRVLSRFATYTPWDGPAEPVPTSEEEREVLLKALYDQMGIHFPSPGSTSDPESPNGR